MSTTLKISEFFLLLFFLIFLGFILVFLGLLLEMAKYGGKLDYHDQPSKSKPEFGTDCLALFLKEIMHSWKLCQLKTGTLHLSHSQRATTMNFEVFVKNKYVEKRKEKKKKNKF